MTVHDKRRECSLSVHDKGTSKRGRWSVIAHPPTRRRAFRSDPIRSWFFPSNLENEVATPTLPGGVVLDLPDLDEVA